MKTILMTLALCCGLSEAAQTVSLADCRIQTRGIQYISQTETGMRFQRHREDVLQLPRKELGLNPDKARNTTGAVIAFCTDSQAITLRFDVLSINYMGAGFGVFENGELIEEIKFNAQTQQAVLTFQSKSSGFSRFEVALPSFANVEFQALELDDASVLGELPDLGKKVYVALGDSISHGVGQDGFGHKTWPFLLSRKLDCELFNLAVGGGKISVPVAEMLKDWEQIDLITILIGYNDLHFDAKTPADYREKYNDLLNAIRKNHPKTKVVCITPLYTKKPVSEKTGVRIEEFRQELTALVQERKKKDSRLFLVAGEMISSEKNLRADNPKDPVHLGVDGAALLADELFGIIGTP